MGDISYPLFVRGNKASMWENFNAICIFILTLENPARWFGSPCILLSNYFIHLNYNNSFHSKLCTFFYLFNNSITHTLLTSYSNTSLGYVLQNRYNR